MNHLSHIKTILASDPDRVRAVNAVMTLALPDACIAAGFVRNAIWDAQYGVKTPLNDVDVIYFDADEVSETKDLELEQQLMVMIPEMPWSVKNQARMHRRNGDAPYLNSLDAMGHWPEKQTAIGVRLIADALDVVHAFDLALWFNGRIDHNPKRSNDVFLHRIQSKGWLQQWPGLVIGDETI